jgi:hypothetical protein
MKKVLVTVLLAFATLAIAQQPTQPTQTGQQPSQPPATGQPSATTPASQKVIKDPAEYNAYITALNTQDPNQKAAAMEAFVKQYPQSVVLVDALEQAMAAYQQAGNQAKVEEMANRILQLNPNNIRALAIITFLKRTQATATTNPQQAQALAGEAAGDAQKGLQALPTWQKPEGMSDPEFEKLKNQMAEIFNGAAGFGALQSKNYPVARDFYLKSIQVDPSNMQDVYQLAIASLEMNPMDINGFWYCAKAINLAQTQNNARAAQGIAQYCKAKYHNYHGGDDGWDQVLAAGAQGTAPPPNFATLIKKAPTPCELAVQAVQQNDVTQLSFSDREFILSKANCAPNQGGTPANKQAADKVWQSIQDMEKNGEARLKIPDVKVISATKDTIDAALTDENKAANKADLHIVMEKPMLHPPAPGATTDIIGVLTSYTPDPFMFTMEHGELPAAKAPVHHTPVRKKKKK